eukprot:1497224-Amphidinium_carterae.1
MVPRRLDAQLGLVPVASRPIGPPPGIQRLDAGAYCSGFSPKVHQALPVQERVAVGAQGSLVGPGASQQFQ